MSNFDYKSWKNWNSFGFISKDEISYFAGEFSRLNLQSKKLDLFEIGFGNGSFLEYYENGSTKFCANYVFDKIEGHATEWHEADLLNSNRFTTDNHKCKYGFVKSYKKYKFGKLNGYSSFYNKDSFLEKKELYIDGHIRKTCN